MWILISRHIGGKEITELVAETKEAIISFLTLKGATYSKRYNFWYFKKQPSWNWWYSQGVEYHIEKIDKI